MKLLEKSQYNNFDVAKSFNSIILSNLPNYDGNKKAQLKSFFEDLQKGGCISGMISEFIYHADCKKFYIENIDELEEIKTDLEESMGSQLKTVMTYRIILLCVGYALRNTVTNCIIKFLNNET